MRKGICFAPLALIFVSVGMFVAGAGWTIAHADWQKAKVQPGQTKSKAQSPETQSTTARGAKSPASTLKPRSTRQSSQADFPPVKLQELPGYGQKTIAGIPGVAIRAAEVDFTELALEEARQPLARRPKIEREKGPVPLDVIRPDEIVVPSPPATSVTPGTKALAPSPTPSSSFLGLEDNGPSFPPDTHGAAGPNHLMVTLNTEIRIQDRQGKALRTVSLDGFWSAIGNPNSFDPKVLYDPYQNRWMMTSTADSFSPTSSVLIGVTQTDDPTGKWNLYNIDADSTDVAWADYPSFGFNKDWIVVTVNMFGNESGGFRGTNAFVFNKADLYARGTGRYTLLQTPAFTLTPAITHSDTLDTIYLVQNVGSGLRLYSITGSVGAEQLNTLSIVSTGDGWSSSEPGFEDSAPQKGTTRKISANDGRIQNVVFRNGTIWATHTIFLPAGDPTRACVQVWQFAPNGAVIQRIVLEDPTSKLFFAFPSLAVNKNNDVLIGYSRFSPDQFASANFVFRGGTDPLNTLRDDTVLKNGEDVYIKSGGGENRWGDYSSTVVDPVNDLDMWTVQEFAAKQASNGSKWGTWWGQIPAPVSGGDTVAPLVEVTTPNGGEPVKGGDRLRIAWTSSDNLAVVLHDVALSTDGGTTFTTSIATGLPGTAGEFTWAVPLIEVPKARIRVSAFDQFFNQAADTSNADFTIARPPLAPPTNLNATVCGQIVALNWEAAANTPGAILTGYNVYRSQTSPVSTLPLNRLGSFSAQTRAFTDRPPIDGQNRYFYAVTSVFNTGESGPSNEISASPDGRSDTESPKVVLVSPNGGEVVEAGGSLQIQWEADDDLCLTSQNIDLSTDSGTTFTRTVATGLAGTARTFAFQVPTALDSTTARIRVMARDASGKTGQDVSERDFTIRINDTIAPTVTITSPSANQKVKLRSTTPFSVTWNSSDNIGITSHDVLLARDSAAPFQSVATGLGGTTRSFSLTSAIVGSAKSKTARIRVVARDTVGNVGMGESAPFRINSK
ncbi:MAG TPA: hypothetical protein PL157_10585 [Acidobacteriota bacterium]|nr:hypothetical protein [Acidobacteriota bacterium]